MLFDAAGNLTVTIDALGNRTSYVMDAANRRTAVADAGGNRATTAYDAAGDVTSVLDGLDRKRLFSYDALNHLTSEKWIDNASTTPTTVNYLTFTYDANGNQTLATDQSGTYTLTLDALDRVTVVNGPWGVTLTFTYDAAGNRTKVEDSKSGLVSSAYDAANQLLTRDFVNVATVTLLRAGLTWTSTHQLGKVDRYPGAGGTSVGTTSFTFDSDERMTGIAGNGGLYTYAYDAAGRVTSENMMGTRLTFTYDSDDELTADSRNTFTYDGEGNRTNTGYTTGSGNRLTSDGVYTYTHDAAGNLVKQSKGASAETWTFGYDHRNEMTWAEKRATDGGTLQMRADYTCDVYGNRIAKAVDADGAGAGPTVTTRQVVDGWKVQQDDGGNRRQVAGLENWDVVMTLDGSNALVTRYVHPDAVDAPLARVTASSLAVGWFLTDRLGSLRTVLNGSGTPIDTLAYDAKAGPAGQLGVRP